MYSPGRAGEDRRALSALRRGAAPPGRPHSATSSSAAAWAAIRGTWCGSCPSSPTSSRPFRRCCVPTRRPSGTAFDAVSSWSATPRQPNLFLLVVDDLQWAAKPNLLAVRRRRPLPRADAGVGLGHRAPRSPAGTDWPRRSPTSAGWPIVRLSLGGLDRTGVLAFMEEAASHDSETDEDLALAGAIHDETEVNPLRPGGACDLTETGAVHHRDGRWATGFSRLLRPGGSRRSAGRRGPAPLPAIGRTERAARACRRDRSGVRDGRWRPPPTSTRSALPRPSTRRRPPDS